MNALQQKIESLLFYKNEPVSFSWLGKHLGIDKKKIEEELYEMLVFYEDRGISLLILEDKASLLTAKESKDIIEKLAKSKSEQELSKQTLETLAIIFYKDGITKAEIDYVRGVNSMYTLRHLLMRGLIEKRQNTQDKRTSRYFITEDTFSYLGIQKKEELPHFIHFKKKLEETEKAFKEESKINREENSL